MVVPIANRIANTHPFPFAARSLGSWFFDVDPRPACDGNAVAVVSRLLASSDRSRGNRYRRRLQSRTGWTVHSTERTTTGCHPVASQDPRSAPPGSDAVCTFSPSSISLRWTFTFRSRRSLLPLSAVCRIQRARSCLLPFVQYSGASTRRLSNCLPLCPLILEPCMLCKSFF